MEKFDLLHFIICGMLITMYVGIYYDHGIWATLATFIIFGILGNINTNVKSIKDTVVFEEEGDAKNIDETKNKESSEGTDE